MKIAAVVLGSIVLATAAAAQQAAPTPPPQSVVVPSLPDQKNKEGVVKPSGALATDSAGWVQNAPGSVDPKAAPASPAGGAPVPPAPVAPGVGGRSVPPAPGPGTAGKPVVGAAYVSLRGAVKAWNKGKSLTIVDSAGRERTVPLAPKADLYEGLAVGDRVVLRIPLTKPADGKSADRVEKQKAGKTPPPSKFSNAQTPAG